MKRMPVNRPVNEMRQVLVMTEEGEGYGSFTLKGGEGVGGAFFSKILMC
jgi:hypothetical protein